MNYSKYAWYVPLENMTKVDNFPKFIIVHHTGSPNDTFESIQRYHIYGRYAEGKEPFENIGYHKLIYKDGTVINGRPEHYHGAHAPGYNKNAIGIALVGNFNKELPTQQQETSLRNLLKELVTRYGIVKEAILPHRAVTSTDCYGNNLMNDWAQRLLDEKVDDDIIEKLQSCEKKNEEMTGKINGLLAYIKKLW